MLCKINTKSRNSTVYSNNIGSKSWEVGNHRRRQTKTIHTTQEMPAAKTSMQSQTIDGNKPRRSYITARQQRINRQKLSSRQSQTIDGDKGDKPIENNQNILVGKHRWFQSKQEIMKVKNTSHENIRVKHGQKPSMEIYQRKSQINLK